MRIMEQWSKRSLTISSTYVTNGWTDRRTNGHRTKAKTALASSVSRLKPHQIALVRCCSAALTEQAVGGRPPRYAVNIRSWEQKFPVGTFAPRSENTGERKSLNPTIHSITRFYAQIYILYSGPTSIWLFQPLSNTFSPCNRHHHPFNMSIPAQSISLFHFTMSSIPNCSLNSTQDSLSLNFTPHIHLIVLMSAQCNACSFSLFIATVKILHKLSFSRAEKERT